MNKERIVSRKATDKSQFKRKPLHFISRKLSKKKARLVVDTDEEGSLRDNGSSSRRSTIPVQGVS